jgi:hypothetical protein
MVSGEIPDLVLHCKYYKWGEICSTAYKQQFCLHDEGNTTYLHVE